MTCYISGNVFYSFSYKQRIYEHPIVSVNDSNYLYELQQVKSTIDQAFHLL